MTWARVGRFGHHELHDTSCGLWVALFAFAVYRRRLKENEIASAYSGLAIFLAAGLFLVYCGSGDIRGSCSRWPYANLPSGKAPTPKRLRPARIRS
jgi:hypothetical protein